MEKIIKHNGIRYEYIENTDKTVSDCTFCDIGRGVACGRFFKCEKYHHYKKVKENNMKKSELSFKCATLTEERLRAILSVLASKGIRPKCPPKENTAKFIYVGGDFVQFGESSTAFFADYNTEVLFDTAFKLIMSIEPDAPEFDIKLREEVLMYDYECQTWELCDFARVAESFFYAIGYGFGACLVRYKGNEILHGKSEMPYGWWECEDGKPVWKTR